MIYLASPYSHPDPNVREARFEAACRAAAFLIRLGHTVFSPIIHNHLLCRYMLPGDWQLWDRHDRRYLTACDEIVVLTLDGWRTSKGVQAEIAIAGELGRPIRFIDDSPDGVRFIDAIDEEGEYNDRA